MFGDVDNFKVQKCNILRTLPGGANMVEPDCDSSGGDSGAPLLRSAQIVELYNSGLQSVFGNDSVNALKTENFYTQVQSAIAKYSVDNTSGNSNTNNNNTVNNNSNNNNANNQTNNNIVNNNPNNGSNNNSDQQLQLLLEQRLQDLDCD